MSETIRALKRAAESARDASEFHYRDRNGLAGGMLAEDAARLEALADALESMGYSFGECDCADHRHARLLADLARLLADEEDS